MHKKILKLYLGFRKDYGDFGLILFFSVKIPSRVGFHLVSLSLSSVISFICCFIFGTQI